MRLKLSWAFSALFLLGLGSPARAAWQEARSAHFIIYADEPAEELRAYARRLERFDKAVRMIRRMPDPALTDSGRVKIYVLPTAGSVQNLYGSSSVVGFYVTQASGSVAFVPRRAGYSYDKFDLDADAVFFHEYAHHLQLQGANAAVPPWVSEGFAEFFARTELRDDGSVVIGVPPAYRSYSLLENNALSLRDMVGADTDRMGYAEFAGIYARGWALTHFLTFAPDRRGQLDRYIAAIQKGVPPLSAAEQTFGDLAKLDAELRRWVQRKTLPQLVLKGVTVPAGSIAIRPLSAAESDIIRVRMRSDRGATRKTADDIASDARHVAAEYPNDPHVEVALAEAEFDAKNYAAAEAAADRAIAARSTGIDALLAKGKAQMELAHQSGHGDWSEIRQWFLKANKRDSEAAEPLMLFYKSYLYAGEQPTRNAVDGLLYAVALAPRDTRLRLMAVHRLLADGKLAAAKRYFGPFAFSPHGRKEWTKASDNAMAAMGKGQGAEALSEIEHLQKLLGEDD